MRQLIIFGFLLYIFGIGVLFNTCNDLLILISVLTTFLSLVFFLFLNLLHYLTWKYLLFSKEFDIMIYQKMLEGGVWKLEEYYNKPEWY